jgi:RNA polymerase sigma-70 factor (ECF subfamily)
MSDSDANRRRIFDELTRNHRRRLSGIARAYAGPQAEDLLQEILLQIWRSLPRLRELVHAGTWAYRIALNTAISWRRRARRHPQLTLDAVKSSAAPAEGGDDVELLRRFQQTLGDVDQALLIMLMEDVSPAEMAEILGVSTGAIRVRIHRLKLKLADWEPLDS